MEKKITIGHLLGIIFLAALIIRIAFILTLDNSVDVWGDWWDELGWSLAQGKGFQVLNPYFASGTPFYSWRAPGFPFFLAIIYRLFGHSFFAAKIALALLSALTALLLHFLGKELVNERIGIYSAMVYAIYPASIFWTGQLAPETLTGFILLAMIFFLVLGEKKNKLHCFLLAGIIMGLGVLTRSAFILFLPMIALWLYFIDRRNNRRLAILEFLLCTLGCALVVTPWTLRNYRIHHQLVLSSTEGGIVCFIANNERSSSEPSGYWNPPPEYFSYLTGMSEVEIDKHLYSQAFSFIKAYPGLFIVRVADRFLRYWRLAPHTFSGPGEPYKQYYVWFSLAFFIPLFALSIYGFLLSLRKWEEFFLLYLIIAVWSLPVILFFKVVIRYREPIMSCLILFAVIGVISRIHRRQPF